MTTKIWSLGRGLPPNLKGKPNKKNTGAVVCNEYGQNQMFRTTACLVTQGRTVASSFDQDSLLKRSIQVVPLPHDHPYYQMLSPEQQEKCDGFDDQVNGLAKMA